MRDRRHKAPREKDLTGRFLSGGLDEDRVEQSETYGARSSKKAQQGKILKTALLRAEEESDADVDSLPVGNVVQVFSLYSEIEFEGKKHLCVIRKTLSKRLETPIVVGDKVRFRVIDDNEILQRINVGNQPEGVIEQLLPRKTVLTRSDSFKALTQHPIVANAEKMLVVVSLRLPDVKWGLVDRMIVAARAGGLQPLICLNKIDLAAGASGTELPDDLVEAREILKHYAILGVPSFEASVTAQLGLDVLRETIKDASTVLAGHSGVGKSSLVRAIQPQLDLRIGAISGYTAKGRHTTTSARHYPLDFGGAVIDTPGVKMFGLWGVTRENLGDYFPDILDGTAPEWRQESFERIKKSLPEAAF